MNLLDCHQTAAHLADYLEQSLDDSSREAVRQHLSACPECRAFAQQSERVRALLRGAGPAQPAGRQEGTSRRLQEITTGHLASVLQPDAVDRGCEDERESLVARLGAAPWWIVSGAFHALLFLLVTLIGMAILRAQPNDTVIVTSLEKKIEPEPEKVQPPRDILRNPKPLETAEQVDPQPEVVVHEEVEISDHFETDERMESQDAFGDEGVSDIPLGGSGVSGAIGVGGGASGAFGRPLGGGSARLRRATQGGGGKETESAVDKGLEWLARNQEPDGHWDAAKHGGSKCNTAMTGFALLAFLGAGHTERVGKYKDHVKRAVEWLGAHQNAEGLVYHNDMGGKGYNHGIAGIALAEAAGMGRVKKTMEIAQKSVDYSVNIHQCGEGSEKRGWRYGPKQEGDLSNTGWFIMQLKSAKVAGLKVPHGGFEGAEWFLDHVEYKDLLQKFPQFRTGEYDNGRHRYGYTGPGATGRLTAIGCLNRLFLGTPVEELQGGIEWMARQGMPKKERVDLYYWYYGTLCTFQYGQDLWKEWNAAMKDALLPAQRVGGPEDGSWDPNGAYAAQWGRVGQTALSVLCLEVYYRYLPMYR